MSPLLANLYMRRFLKAWRDARQRPAMSAARIVNYADDFVILCRRHAAEAALAWRRNGAHEDWVNAQRRRRRESATPGIEPFDFLGYSFGVQYRFGGRTTISRRRVRRRRVFTGSRKRFNGWSATTCGRQSKARPHRQTSELPLAGLDELLQLRYVCGKRITRLERFVQERIRALVPGQGTNIAWVHGENAEIPARLHLRDARSVNRHGACIAPLAQSLEEKPDRRAGCGKSARPVR